MICLVRHGKTAYNAERRLQGKLDIPLCYEGLLQAERLGRQLKTGGPRFGSLYCSTLSRARVTAEIVGRRLGLAPKPVEGLHEIYFGKFQNHTFAEIEALYPEEYAAYTADRAHCASHGGETPYDVLARARRALLSLPEAEAESRGEAAGNALVVCHGAVIAYLRAAACGRPLDEILDLIPDNAELIPLGKEELEHIADYRA